MRRDRRQRLARRLGTRRPRRVLAFPRSRGISPWAEYGLWNVVREGHTNWWRKLPNCYFGDMEKGTTIRRETRKKRALGRSLSDFPYRNKAEKEIIAAAREGRLAHFGNRIPKTEREKKERTIRAGLVRFLALGGDDLTPVHERGVRVQGAIIDGAIDLESCDIKNDVILRNCKLTDALTLRGARVRTIGLDGSNCQGISADRVEVAGNLHLRDGFIAEKLVRILGGKITGNLDCNGGRFEGRDNDGDAFNCNGLEIGGYLFLRKAVVIRGGLQMLGANIGRNLECDDVQLQGRSNNGRSLNGDSAEIGGSVFLRRAVVEGQIKLMGATIVGNLECDGIRISGGGNQDEVLQCERVQVGGNVFLRSGFAAAGTVTFLGASLNGDVRCNGGHFGLNIDDPESNGAVAPNTTMNLSAPVLSLARATVKGTLWLAGRSPPSFHGGIDLIGARIGRIVDSITPTASYRDPSSSGAGSTPAFQRLDGLTYSRFGEWTDLSAAARIQFLRLQPEADLGNDFKPHPWMQMISVLRDTGHADAARHVAIAYEDTRRRAGNTGLRPFVSCIGSTG